MRRSACSSPVLAGSWGLGCLFKRAQWSAGEMTVGLARITVDQSCHHHRFKETYLGVKLYCALKISTISSTGLFSSTYKRRHMCLCLSHS